MPGGNLAVETKSDRSQRVQRHERSKPKHIDAMSRSTSRNTGSPRQTQLSMQFQRAGIDQKGW
jgi:hypothetical protein